MTYKETGFRPFYHHFVAVPVKDNLRASIQEYPSSKDANYILTYGYIDHECGLTLEVLASAKKNDTGFRFAETNTTIKSFIRIGAVEEDEVLFVSDENGELLERYAEKIDMLHHYDVSEEVEKTRNMFFFGWM